MKIGDKVRCTNPDGNWLEWGKDYYITYVFTGGAGFDCLVSVEKKKRTAPGNPSALGMILWSPDRFEFRG